MRRKYLNLRIIKPCQALWKLFMQFETYIVILNFFLSGLVIYSKFKFKPRKSLVFTIYRALVPYRSQTDIAHPSENFAAFADLTCICIYFWQIIVIQTIACYKQISSLHIILYDNVTSFFSSVFPNVFVSRSTYPSCLRYIYLKKYKKFEYNSFEISHSVYG